MMPASARFALIALALAACGPTPTQTSQPAGDSAIGTSAPAAGLPSEPPTSGPPEVAPPIEQISDCPLAAHEPVKGKLRLAYLIQGDLWLRDDTDPPRLLVEEANAEAVTLSPDGSIVVFSRRSDTNSFELWAVGASGESLRRLSGEGGIPGSIEIISFSGDGRLIVFQVRVDPDSELWIAETSGAGARVLVSAAELRGGMGRGADYSVGAVNVGWMPGSQRLTFVPISLGIGGDTFQFFEPVYIVDADDRNLNLFLPTGEGGYITYSPDGQTMVIADPTRIRLTEANLPEELRTVLQYPAIDMGLDALIPPPAWSPDSSSFLIAVATEGENPDQFFDYGVGPLTVWEIFREGSVRKLSEYVGAHLWFQFSPDAKRVAYYQLHEQREVHIARVDGSQDVVVASGEGAGFEVWLPDARRFAYRTAAGSLAIGDICGGTTPITLPPEADPNWVWVDDSRFLLFVGPWGGWDLLLGTSDSVYVKLAEFGDNPIYSYTVIRE